ncbi:MAG: undecaprenyl-phosphate galactose phosphotransferase WbaP [Anaerolineaceae bacterium]|nr:undecaprenyl-phosphate galactose phosphotransferase WbaP [Anaerolineaceae bacterium]
MNQSQQSPFKKAFYENRSKIVILILVVQDIVTISLAVLLSGLIRQLLIPILGGEVNWHLIFTTMIFYVLFTILVAWWSGLYPGFGLAAVREMQKILYVVSLSSIFLGVVLFMQQLALAYSRSIFIFTWFFSALLMLLGRFALRNLLSKRSWWGIPMALIGPEESITPIIEKLLSNRRLGFRPVFYYDPLKPAAKPILNVQPIATKEELFHVVSQAGLQYVMFSASSGNDELIQEFQGLRDVVPNIMMVLNASPFGSLWVQTIDLHGTLILETNYHLLNKRERGIKRILDMTLTLLLLLVSIPIFMVLALVIKLDSKGPILYTQKRLGKDGIPFDSYKFRTMFINAEEKLSDLLAADPEAAEEYTKYHKLAKDPRVTRVGRFLRRYSLDELPQLINVVKGDMNLIAPRSYLPRELDAIGDYANIILKVKPGLTGWWQVMGRNATSFQERLQLDAYYISNWSVWLDIYIVIKTVWVLISGQGL